MADLPDRDVALVLDMLSAARDATDFVRGMDLDGFRASRLHQNAVIRSVEVVGEAAGRVSDATVAAHPDIPWRSITGMRHRLIHGYADVDIDLVWSVTQHQLPELIALLDALISTEGPEDIQKPD
ncbi:DUF86 domain-containing protein [Marinibaculum pumilum]|uniref:DUF86 domain-containing protein n=1 Tax=Marinibaculum pumilum TaxID=1766165 RepID=A0ABV7KVW1_9PROT